MVLRGERLVCPELEIPKDGGIRYQLLRLEVV